MSISRFAIALAVGGLVSSPAREPVSIRFEPPLFKVVGWEPARAVPASEWPQIFSVYAGEGDLPPILGSYRMAEGALVFEPRFPLTPGLRYRAVFRAPARAPGVPIQAIFELPRQTRAPSTRVAHVYPSTGVLPGNQLKFYICFSAPMQRGEAWRRIHLIESSGRPIELPFLELEQELWDPGFERLTVLFDPGRIKRGLLPLQEAGPAIEEGKQYTLIVDAGWLDARGVPLVDGFRKPFRVGPADRTPPDPKQWRVEAPIAGTRQALIVDFPKPMDYALVSRLLEIPNVHGRIAIERDEKRWTFTPGEPWKPGEYRVLVDTALEDLAGNRIGRAFDVDVFERVERIEKKQIALPFRVRKE